MCTQHKLKFSYFCLVTGQSEPDLYILQNSLFNHFFDPSGPSSNLISLLINSTHFSARPGPARSA